MITIERRIHYRYPWLWPQSNGSPLVPDMKYMENTGQSWSRGFIVFPNLIAYPGL